MIATATEATHDRRLLLAAAFLRAVGTSLVGVLLGIHLAGIGWGAAEIGWISGAGLFGATLAALATTLFADRFGRRRALVALSLLGALGASMVVVASTPWVVAVAAFLGMVNAMGRDRGGPSILEQAALPATVSALQRTRAFAWYSALQDSGHALGSLAAGAPALLVATAGWSTVTANRAGLAILPALLVVAAALYLALSPAVERGATEAVGPRLSPASRRTLWRLSSLFALDGLGGGLLLTTLLSYFFFERFGVGAATIAVLFFVARIANVVSHFGAAWLAARIGLVNTMVFTHLPSSLLLVAIAFVPSFPVAAVLFILRESLVEMDVPTRQSYVMAVVAPAERTAAAGVTNLVRLATWAVGPLFGGLAMQRLGLAAPLLAGAGLKIVYDLMLYAAFRHQRPPEEQ